MDEIKHVQEFCGWTREQARMAQDGRFLATGIDNVAQAIETLARSERHEPVSLPLWVYPRKSEFPPAKRYHRLRLLKEDKDANARSRFARKFRLRPQPDHSVAHARGLAVIGLDKRVGLSLRTFRSSSTRSFDQLMSYDIWSADA